MRTARLVVLAAMLAFSGAGCSYLFGGSSETATLTATGPPPSPPPDVVTVGPPPAPPGGTASADALNRRLSAVDEKFERTPAGVASEFASLVATEARKVSLDVVANPDGGDAAAATIVVDGLLDDSVRALRYELALERAPDGTWRIASVEQTQRCAPGRGHQNFSTAPCV